MYEISFGDHPISGMKRGNLYTVEAERNASACASELQPESELQAGFPTVTVAGVADVDERRKRNDEETKGGDKRARVEDEEEVPTVRTVKSTPEKRIVRTESGKFRKATSHDLRAQQSKDDQGTCPEDH